MEKYIAPNLTLGLHNKGLHNSECVPTYSMLLVAVVFLVRVAYLLMCDRGITWVYDTEIHNENTPKCLSTPGNVLRVHFI